MTDSPHRFQDTREWISSFGWDLLIKCPRCGGCARSSYTNAGRQVRKRSTCGECGFSADHLTDHRPAYDYVGSLHLALDLWLQTECCGHVLWALNSKHLDFLEALVAASLRERRPSECGWSNHALSGRLPRWITSAKNRKEVLRGLQRLHGMLPSESGA